MISGGASAWRVVRGKRMVPAARAAAVVGRTARCYGSAYLRFVVAVTWKLTRGRRGLNAIRGVNWREQCN